MSKKDAERKAHAYNRKARKMDADVRAYVFFAEESNCYEALVVDLATGAVIDCV